MNLPKLYSFEIYPAENSFKKSHILRTWRCRYTLCVAGFVVSGDGGADVGGGDVRAGKGGVRRAGGRDHQAGGTHGHHTSLRGDLYPSHSHTSTARVGRRSTSLHLGCVVLCVQGLRSFQVY